MCIKENVVKSGLQILGIYFMIFGACIYMYLSMTHFQRSDYSAKSMEVTSYWSKHGWIASKGVPMYTDTLGHSSLLMSHPPGAYTFLYAFGKVYRSPYYFVANLLLTILSACFIYLTISLLSLKKAQSEFSIYGLIGVLIYTTHPSVLRFQVLNFHPDIFVQTILIISIYVFTKMLMKQRYHSFKYIFFFCLCLFIMNYSSWFGAVYTFCLILMGLFSLRRSYQPLFFVLLAVGILGLSHILIYSQYSSAAGWKEVLSYFKNTYIQESFLSGGIRQTFWQIFWQICQNIGNLLGIILLLFFAALIQKRRRFVFTKNGYRYLVIAIFPTIFYAFLFIQYFQNGYTSLYLIGPLTVIIAIWLEKMYHEPQYRLTLLKIIGVIVLSNISLFALYITHSL